MIYHLKLSLERNAPAILESRQWMTSQLMSVNLDTVQRRERERKCSDPNSLRTSTGEQRCAEAMQLEIETRWSAQRELELSNRSIWGPTEPFTAKSLEGTLMILGVKRKHCRISRAFVFGVYSLSIVITSCFWNESVKNNIIRLYFQPTECMYEQMRCIQTRK